MPISRVDMLFSLVKSLSKGEKRHFRLYAKRESDGVYLKYLHLFDLLDKQKEIDEDILLESFEKRQLTNLKRHLYTQILVALRLLQRKENIAIKLREFLDFANILYSRGLFLQSLRLIEKAKSIAVKISDEPILLKLLEFEKIIESRHITRTGTNKAENLTIEANNLIDQLSDRIKISNLRLLLHGWYIEHGHVRSEDMERVLRLKYSEALEAVDVLSLGLMERAFYHQAKVWFHYILLEFDLCLISAKEWLSVFKGGGDYIQRDSNIMMRAYHYILTSLYYLGKEKEYVTFLEEFEDFRKSNYKRFNRNSQIISFLYVHNGRLNKFILTKKYKEGVALIPKTLSRISRYRKNLDAHRILVFFYKLAVLYLMADKPDQSIKYLHTIINEKLGNLRKDIQIYARLLFLMVHYSAGNHDLLEYLIKRTKKFLKSNNIETKMPNEVVTFFTILINAPLLERQDVMRGFLARIRMLSEERYEKRGIVYLNVREWLMHSIK